MVKQKMLYFSKSLKFFLNLNNYSDNNNKKINYYYLETTQFKLNFQ